MEKKESIPKNSSNVFTIRQDEEWKDVVGYEGYYSVSNYGRVWSHYSEKLLKPIMTKAGYVRAHLSLNGEVKARPVHRLVAEAFIPNPDGKPTVNHINEIKTDNYVGNLEWATTKEQNVHGTRIARAVAHTDYALRSEKIDYGAIAAKHNYHEININQRKPVLQIDKNGAVIACYEGLSVAARSLGISVSHICCCLKGRRNYCGGYQWRYA